MSDLCLRILGPDDVEAYRSLRLEALELEPGSYCSRFERERHFPEETWLDRLSQNRSATFGLFDGPQMVGLTAICIAQDQPDTGLLVQTYIRLGYRGRGLSQRFHEARRKWAQSQGLRRLVVGCREDNVASVAAIQRAGFRRFEIQTQQWPDGQTAALWTYELLLSPPEVRVGIGVLIEQQGRVLLGKRKGAHGAGEYAWPGGHLEFGETMEQCVVRETAEETGLIVRPIRPVSLSNVIKYGRHYVDIQFLVEVVSGTPEVLEPDKVESWDWYPINALPEPLFEFARRGLEGYLANSGISYFSVQGS